MWKGRETGLGWSIGWINQASLKFVLGNFGLRVSDVIKSGAVAEEQSGLC